jgi:hypothetical protein
MCSLRVRCIHSFKKYTLDPRVTTGLTYEQLGLRPECLSRPKRVSACAAVNKDPRWVRKRQSEPRYPCLWTFYNFLASTLGKLLVFLVNYAHYTTLFNYEKLGKRCFGRFGAHYVYFHYFLWGKIVLTYDQLELRPALRTNWVRKSRVHCI